MNLRIFTAGMAALGLAIYTLGLLLSGFLPEAASPDSVAEVAPASFASPYYVTADEGLSLLVVRAEVESASPSPWEVGVTAENPWIVHFPTASESTLTAALWPGGLNFESINPIQEEGRK